jgi:hypothetical protein
MAVRLIEALEHGQRDLMVGAARELHLGREWPADDCLVGLLERVTAVSRRVHERPIHVPEHQEHSRSLPNSALVLGALTLPPRLVFRALDDLHALADGVRRLSEREGDLSELLESVRVLPAVEDELSARIDLLRKDVESLHAWLQPLHTELTDLDATAESLEKALAGVQVTIQGFHEELRDLRERIPGI